jgi:DNA-binding XRE family transcriptional regulator/Uma2 family endonuclease
MHNRLRILRADRNWSQAELAKRLGVSRQTINALEVGRYDPSLPLALKIAHLFDCSIETVFLPDPLETTEDHAMFRRFTEKAIQSITLAQEESRRLGHNFVGTEFILLGLIAENTGLAAKVLKAAGVKLEDVRREVEKIIGRGNEEDKVEIPFTPKAKMVLNYAKQESRQLRLGYIGTEHLLLGTLRVPDGVAVRVLEALGINIQNLRQQVLNELSPIASSSAPMPASASAPIITDESMMDAPADFTSGEVSTRFCARLFAWVEPRQLGYVLSSSVGYRLGNGEVVAPRCSFILKERLKRAPRTYPELMPDLIMEIKSAFDRLAPMQEKVLSFVNQGIRVGLLIDPDQRTVTVYRSNAAEAVLEDGQLLAIPELLPGWELPISELWGTVA